MPTHSSGGRRGRPRGRPRSQRPPLKSEPKQERGEGSRQPRKRDEQEDDPNYTAFLRNVRPHPSGKSYTYEAKSGADSVRIKYGTEEEDSSSSSSAALSPRDLPSLVASLENDPTADKDYLYFLRHARTHPDGTITVHFGNGKVIRYSSSLSDHEEEEEEDDDDEEEKDEVVDSEEDEEEYQSDDQEEEETEVEELSSWSSSSSSEKEGIVVKKGDFRRSSSTSVRLLCVCVCVFY